MTQENLTYKIITKEFEEYNFEPLKFLTIEDKNFILESNKTFCIDISYIDEKLYDDYDICMMVILENCDYFYKIPEKFKKDKIFMVEFIKHVRIYYGNKFNIVDVVTEYLYDDDKIMEELIQHWMNTNTYTVQEFLKKHDYNPKIVNMACKYININYDFFGFKSIIKHFKKDEDICSKLANAFGFSIIFMTEEMRSNYQIIKLAVKSSPMSLKYASDELRNNEEIVRTAVRNCGWALRYASLRLRNNYNVVMDAVMNEPLKDRLDISSEIKFIKYEIFRTGYAQYKLPTHISLTYASSRLRKNKDIVRAAIERYPMAVKGVNKDLLTKRSLYIDKDDKYENMFSLYFDLNEKKNYKIATVSYTLQEDLYYIMSDIIDEYYKHHYSEDRVMCNEDIKYNNTHEDIIDDENSGVDIWSRYDDSSLCSRDCEIYSSDSD